MLSCRFAEGSYLVARGSSVRRGCRTRRRLVSSLADVPPANGGDGASRARPVSEVPGSRTLSSAGISELGLAALWRPGHPRSGRRDPPPVSAKSDDETRARKQIAILAARGRGAPGAPMSHERCLSLVARTGEDEISPQGRSPSSVARSDRAQSRRTIAPYGEGDQRRAGSCS